MPVAPLRQAADPDLIVIGGGLGGLCAAGLAARHGLEVLVLEAHDRPGGAAHGFQQRGFRFESGPSLWSGLGRWPSADPLAQVLRALGETVAVAPYRDWGLRLPEGSLRVGVGPDGFTEVVRDLRGPGAAEEWRRFLRALEPACRAARALPLLALRSDLGTPAVLGPGRCLALLRRMPRLAGLGGSFGPIARRHLRDPFLLHWVGLLSFLISGLELDRTSAAAMATLFGAWFEPDARLEYPLGGSPSIVAALVRGLERHGGSLRTRAAVEEILVAEGGARGVRLAGGERIGARRGVIANLSPWDLPALLPTGSVPERWRRQEAATPSCGSFLHWHLGLRGEDLAGLPIHHVWVGDWRRGISAERNVVVLSMPSVLDPSLAPDGHQVLHGYTPASEPWELWRDLARGTPAYERRKAERCRVFGQVFEGIVPDWRTRAVLERHGTPLTQRHYLRIHQGSYGPAWPADRGPFPGGATPLPNLVRCGSGVFPGIGVPAVAVSGALAAHRFVSPGRQRRLLEETGILPGSAG